MVLEVLEVVLEVLEVVLEVLELVLEVLEVLLEVLEVILEVVLEVLESVLMFFWKAPVHRAGYKPRSSVYAEFCIESDAQLQDNNSRPQY